jgi:GTP-binding protein
MPKPSRPSIELIKTAYTSEQLMKLCGPAVIFLGRSNAGKSSLINALARSDLAKVSKSPGKTRSINYFRYGPRLLLVDLPGFGYARRAKTERDEWAALVQSFFDGAPPRLMGFLLVDAQRKIELEEDRLIQALRERSYPVLILLTKADKLNQSERHQRESIIRGSMGEDYQFISVKSGEGIEELRRAIYRYEKEKF